MSLHLLSNLRISRRRRFKSTHSYCFNSILMWFFSAWAMAMLCQAGQANRSPVAEAATNNFRVGISFSSFGSVSRNDASAALKAWVATVSKERGLSLNVQVEVFEGENDLSQALYQDRVDALSMSAEEFHNMAQKPDEIFLTARSNEFTEHYVLLVRQGSGIHEIAELKGRKIAQHSSPKTSLAQFWLDNLLGRQNLGRAKVFFGEFSRLESPSKTLLRVFFHQSDACIITTNAFALACELNPQIAKELEILAISPPVVPALFFFRSNYNKAIRKELETAIQDLHSTPAGQQVLTVFQGDRMLKQPLCIFDETQRLLREYDQLLNSPSTPRGPEAENAVPKRTAP